MTTTATKAAKILVVDDTPMNVKLLVDILSARGYVVASATDGEDALAKLAADMPDLVLLDIMMPGLSGYDVCRRIRADAATSLLPVVLVTSLDPQAERLHGIEAGAGRPTSSQRSIAGSRRASPSRWARSTAWDN